jgi:hypothetical protein
LKKTYKILIILILTTSTLSAQSGSYPGSFARLGFGARGLSMGNAMVSNIFTDVSGNYNPALACFQEQGIVDVGYTFMSLDRKLNFLGFAKKFMIPGQKSSGAGITLGWINSGVGNIDGRDNDSRELGILSTFENQFDLATSFLLSDQVAIGIGFKLYYAKLYDKVTTNSIAFDLGTIYKATDELAFGLSIRDISAKYKWETSVIYGSLGTTTINKFPTLWDFGASYKLPKNSGSVSLQFEYQVNPIIEDKINGLSSKRDNTVIVKIGGEYFLNEHLLIRAGIDRINLKSKDFMGNLKPGLGIKFGKSFTKDIILALEYSFQFEPYTKSPIQNIGVNFKFK